MEQTYAEKIDIAGTGISNVSLQEVMDLFDDTISKNEKIRVCVTPVNCVVWAHENKYLQDIYNSADLTLCDGVPLMWFARFLGRRIKERVTGLDLLPEFLERSARKGHSVFLLGAKEGVADHLKKVCEERYQGIDIVGTYSPPFAERFSDEENNKMIAMINEKKVNVLFVSLTAPKQDIWIYEHLAALNVNVVVGVGGAFEVTAGLIQRAPKIMQKMGLEWAYRFYKEPKRLFRRYFIEAPKIFSMVWKQRSGSH